MLKSDLRLASPSQVLPVWSASIRLAPIQNMTHRNIFRRPEQSSVAFRYAHLALIACCCLFTGFRSCQAAERLVTVQDAQSEYTGKIVALNRARCTLMDRQGRLVELDVPQLKGMKQVADRFRADSVSAFRSSLGAEFGKRYEVTGTTHYLVCAPRGRAKKYADLFETIYRDVDKFYRVRGFKVTRPDVPLVAVVFASRKEFSQYCVRDDVPPSPGLQGYYSLVSNRVALFDESGSLNAAAGQNSGRHANVLASAAVNGQTAGTIVHETIHQVGYNIGIHTRLGETPLWMVEGMATVLEPDAMRHRNSSRAVAGRLNSERYDWFRHKYMPSHSPGSLAQLIASDKAFGRQTLNAYSVSWALTYFLLENPARRRQLTSYLQAISSRDSTVSYPAKERLADFTSAFGDIARLEVNFIRFMQRL